MRVLLERFFNALGAFTGAAGFSGLSSVGLAGLLAGAIFGTAVLALYFVLKDRLNPFRRAKDSAERGHLRRALALLAIELHRNPANRLALLLRADMERDRGLYAEAEEDYYSLIDLKKPGDGIDAFEVKKRLIPVLHGQGKLLDTLKVTREVLSVEESSADALYHLGLLYLGQLYYREAWKVLERVIGSRPRMAPAFRAASIALVQLGDYEKAIECAKNAFQIDGDPLCTLVMAAALFLLGNSREAERVLALLPRGEKTFESPKHVQLYHRLCAFAALKSSSHDSAAEHFSKVLQALKREEDEGKKGHGPGIYNQFGRIENGEETPRGAGGASPKTKGMDGELVRDFFRLKEVIRDDERLSGIGLSRPVRPGAGSAGVQGADSTGTFLDLEGLSRLTWAALDLGFSLVRAGRLARARAVFEELSRSNPEVIGVRRVIELIGEKEAEQAEGKSPALGDIREKTDRVIEKKKRRYELWEYVERWEENAIRPHHLMAASGLAARRRLNPSILFPGSHSG